jgi:hypothetical protein
MAIRDFLARRGPDNSDDVMTELEAAIAEQKLRHEGGIYRVGRRLRALVGAVTACSGTSKR